MSFAEISFGGCFPGGGSTLIYINIKCYPVLIIYSFNNP